jgi:UDP-N-acetylglucosamine 2-epimerase (non-hydrolysing)
MNQALKLFILFGTRPELIKIAPLAKELQQMTQLKLVATGQHTDLVESHLKLLNVPITYRLECSEPDLLNNFWGISKGLRSIMVKDKPEVIIVQGDTLTTFAGAFTGFMEKIPVLHLEAGLRTGDKFAPFPEEMYRMLVDKLADIFLAPTFSAYQKLLQEGEREDRIFLVGNTAIDALEMAIAKLNPGQEYAELAQVCGRDKETLRRAPKVLITAHRRENIGAPLANISKAILALAQMYPQTLFLWPLHKNPAVRGTILAELSAAPPNLILTEALPYSTTLFMMQEAEVILTDSGGIQEEAPTFKKPIIILRDATERYETVEYGFGFLTGADAERIVERFKQVYDNPELKSRLQSLPNPYGDGKTAERIRQLFSCSKFQRFIKNYAQNPTEDLSDCKQRVEAFRPATPLNI